MPATKPLYLKACIAACHFLAGIVATTHYFLSLAGVIKVSRIIITAPAGRYKNLTRIWFTRFLKRSVSALLRSPLRYSATKLLTVDFYNKVTENTVIVSCHTPWARLIASWCDQNKYSMIIGGRAWQKRVGIANYVDDLNQIKELIRYLHNGGCVIIMADVFNNDKDCPVDFMDEKYNASSFPLRLAKATNSKLITVVPQLKNDSIRVAFGPAFDLTDDPANDRRIMQDTLTYFEKEIRNDPSVWLKFIRSTSAGKAINEKSSKDFTASSIELLNVEQSASLH